MNKMTQEMELAQILLRGAYPENQGWRLSLNTEVDGTKVAFSFQKEDQWILIPPLSREPFVSMKYIKRASALKKRFLSEYSGTDVQVILVYGKLLFPPEYLPDNIAVFSMQEDDSNTTNPYEFCVDLN